MCTMIAKEAIALNSSSNSTVYCVFLDLSKAFDRVEYCKLLKLLMDRHVPRQVTRLLLNMYTGQQVRVLWNIVASSNFRISNCVKQGAIVSPISFCVYLDTLLIKLKKARVGCFIGNWFVAALGYAVDVVLLAPTARAM
jgi:Reverse transcriptase (RNA-dependent DNA polymerase)